MLRFTSEPEGSAYTLSARLIKTIRVWFHFGMFLFSESDSYPTVGGYPFLYCERSDHVEMVEITDTIGWREIATFLGGFLEPVGPRHVDGR